MGSESLRLLLSSTGLEGGGAAPPEPPPAPGPEPAPQDHGGHDPEPAASAWQGITDALRQHGVELPDDVDDERALSLAAQAIRDNRQNDYWVRLGQHAASQAQQAQQPAAPQAPAKDPVAEALAAAGYRPPPEWNPSWKNALVQDADGNVVARPGQDPSIARRFQEYAEWRSQAQDHILGNLPSILKAAVAAQVQPLLQEQQQQVMAQVESQQAQRLIDQNRDHLFQAGTNSPTPLGQAVYRHVEKLQQMGVRGMENQLTLALSLARAEVGQAPPAPTPQGGYPAGAQRLAPTGGQQAQNRLVGIRRGPAPEPSQRGLSFEEMLRNDFQSSGALPPG
jgi:hypothetical protein